MDGDIFHGMHTNVSYKASSEINEHQDQLMDCPVDFISKKQYTIMTSAIFFLNQKQSEYVLPLSNQMNFVMPKA